MRRFWSCSGRKIEKERGGSEHSCLQRRGLIPSTGLLFDDDSPWGWVVEREFGADVCLRGGRGVEDLDARRSSGFTSYERAFSFRCHQQGARDVGEIGAGGSLDGCATDGTKSLDRFFPGDGFLFFKSITQFHEGEDCAGEEERGDGENHERLPGGGDSQLPFLLLPVFLLLLLAPLFLPLPGSFHDGRTDLHPLIVVLEVATGIQVGQGISRFKAGKAFDRIDVKVIAVLCEETPGVDQTGKLGVVVSLQLAQGGLGNPGAMRDILDRPATALPGGAKDVSEIGPFAHHAKVR